jgi:hypothetical protein
MGLYDLNFEGGTMSVPNPVICLPGGRTLAYASDLGLVGAVVRVVTSVGECHLIIPSKVRTRSLADIGRSAEAVRVFPRGDQAWRATSRPRAMHAGDDAVAGQRE